MIEVVCTIKDNIAAWEERFVVHALDTADAEVNAMLAKWNDAEECTWGELARTRTLVSVMGATPRIVLPMHVWAKKPNHWECVRCHKLWYGGMKPSGNEWGGCAA